MQELRQEEREVKMVELQSRESGAMILPSSPKVLMTEVEISDKDALK